MLATYKQHIALGLVLLGLALFSVLWQRPENAQGSASIGESYNATSTVNTVNWASATAFRVLKTGSGQLGSIVVSSTSPITTYPSMKCYDSSVSTTTASSTLITIGSSPVAGTYTVDAIFDAGLICEAPVGFNGGYTITWK